jgi:hypothetical protein
VLVITEEQRKIMADEHVARQLERHWLASFPSHFKAATAEEVSDFADCAVNQARELGIDDDQMIFIWADLCLVNKTSFAENLE